MSLIYDNQRGTNSMACGRRFLLSLLVLLSYMALILVLSIKSAPEGLSGLWQMDKLIHAGVYGVMGLLALRVTSSWFAGNKGRATLYAFLISFNFGALMEVVQSFIPLREGSIYDCIANGVGAFIGVYIIAVILVKVCRAG